MELDTGTLVAIMIALVMSWVVMGLLIFRVIELSKVIEIKNETITIQSVAIETSAENSAKVRDSIIKAIGKSKNYNEQFGVGPS